MRRPLLLAVLVLSIAMVAAAPAAGKPPAHSHAFGHSLIDWQKRWIGWVFGSSTNPLMNGICGEKVDGVFFLSASTGGFTDVDCHLKPGTRLLVSPGGAVAWAPTDGQTPEELLASRASFLADVSNPTATLDGRPLKFDQTPAKTGVYTIPLEPGNLIQTVDPGVSGDQTQVASGGWFLRLMPLRPGHRELATAADIGGSSGGITFHITVGH